VVYLLRNACVRLSHAMIPVFHTLFAHSVCHIYCTVVPPAPYVIKSLFPPYASGDFVICNARDPITPTMESHSHPRKYISSGCIQLLSLTAPCHTRTALLVTHRNNRQMRMAHCENELSLLLYDGPGANVNGTLILASPIISCCHPVTPFHDLRWTCITVHFIEGCNIGLLVEISKVVWTAESLQLLNKDKDFM